jgi:predicted ATP-dependent serine protease
MPRFHWQCLACGATEHSKIAPEVCPTCGAIEAFTEPEETGRPRPRVVAAVTISDAAPVRRPTHDARLDELLGGGFAWRSWSSLWGQEGSGKSRLALRWSTHIGRVLWCSLEMPQQLVRDTAVSCGAKIDRLFIAEDAQPHDVVSLASEIRANVIVYDSISELGHSEADTLLDVVREWSCDARSQRFSIVICHATKDGNYRGPSTIGHAPDYVLQAAPHDDGCEVTIRKSRFCGRGSVVCPLIR